MSRTEKFLIWCGRNGINVEVCCLQTDFFTDTGMPFQEVNFKVIMSNVKPKKLVDQFVGYGTSIENAFKNLIALSLNKEMLVSVKNQEFNNFCTLKQEDILVG